MRTAGEDQGTVFLLDLLNTEAPVFAALVVGALSWAAGDSKERFSRAPTSGGRRGEGGVDTFCIQVCKRSRLSHHLQLTACQVAFPRGNEDRREGGSQERWGGAGGGRSGLTVSCGVAAQEEKNPLGRAPQTDSPRPSRDHSTSVL